MPEPDTSATPYTQAQDLDLIRDVVREAGELAMHWFRKGAEIWDKSPNHPVTEADIAVNNLIAKRLLDARSTYGWLSEESLDDSDQRDACRVFVVDPIDGTKAFIRGEPYFCVSIARLEQDIPVVGVIYNPSTDELFEAERGKGARLNGKPIHVSGKQDLNNLRVMAHAPTIDVADMPEPWRHMQFCDNVPNAIAYRLCLVADGRWDAALAMSPKSDWDLAAAMLIVQEAGGLCTDARGERFSFNGRIPVQRSVVAASEVLHSLLIEPLKLISGDEVASYHKARDAYQAHQISEQDDRSQSDGSTATRTKLMEQAATAQKQLLHIVFGGELKDVTGVEFEDLSALEFVGAYGSYQAAYDAWKSAAQRTVDNAEMRFFILHAHRLLDPETGHTHDV